ncbi:MAG: sulfatase-like hydrolase/transferase [Halovenus sp.]
MRNIVLVTIDSLRADHCGFLNRTCELTPTLDALAADGIAFENAIVPGPRTPSSMPVVWTGEHISPRNLGIYTKYDEKKSRARERRARIRRHLTRHRTLPQRLSERGYTTAGVTANPWTSSDTAFDRGFDVFHSIGESPEMQRTDLTAKLGSLLTDGEIGKWLLRWTDFYETVEEARSELDEPYFLWVFLLDPHQPYVTPREYRVENTALETYYASHRFNNHFYTDELPARIETRVKRAYRDTIRSVDAFTEQLLDDVEDDPVVVIHSDHGEAFGEHGFYGHRTQLYEENIHVPLLVSGLGSSSAVTAPVSLRQLPRLIEACSVNTFRPEEVTSPVVVTKTEEEERVAVRTETWKYIRGGETWEYVRVGEGEELYQLSEDPQEQTNRVRDCSAATECMQTQLHRHRESLDERDRIAQATDTIEL